MTRNQIFTTLEFLNDNVRMVLGEYYNDKFYVYEIYESPCEGLSEGVIISFSTTITPSLRPLQGLSYIS